MISQHNHWRTVEEWDRLGVPLTTPSNVASKMYDATLTQMMAHYDDPVLGGVMTTVQAMKDADPHFVVGQSLSLNLELFGGRVTLPSDRDLQHKLDLLQKEVEGQGQLSSAERRHATATQRLAEGDMSGACALWEGILVDHPHDVLSLKMANLGNIYLGRSSELRDSIARVLPQWTTSTPLYGYLLGMHAFGLEETNLYQQAERQATKALEVNEHDAWATHTMSHVYEMTGQQQQGIDFLDSTLSHWSVCGHLACHNWWHLALHHVELGNFEAALDIFEKQVKALCVKQGDVFNITDAASLLFRLEMQGVKTEGRWEALGQVCQPYLYKHRSVFNDLHLVMTSLGQGDLSGTQSMLDSVEKFVREGQGNAREVHGAVGLAMCRALTAYKEGDPAKAVDLLYPLRYNIISVGGSHAQRDVFHQLLVVSALQSPNTQHHKLARALLAERKALKENSPLTDRLMTRLTAE